MAMFLIYGLSVNANSNSIGGNESSTNNLKIYYPNGDWRYESVDIIIPDECENELFFAIIKGKNNLALK